jgi:hypothetical protein
MASESIKRVNLISSVGLNRYFSTKIYKETKVTKPNKIAEYQFKKESTRRGRLGLSFTK